MGDIDDGFKWQERAPPETVFEELSTALPQQTPIEKAETVSEIEEERIFQH